MAEWDILHPQKVPVSKNLSACICIVFCLQSLSEDKPPFCPDQRSSSGSELVARRCVFQPCHSLPLTTPSSWRVMCAQTCPERHSSPPCIRQHVSPHGGLRVVLGTREVLRKHGWAPAFQCCKLRAILNDCPGAPPGWCLLSYTLAFMCVELICNQPSPFHMASIWHHSIPLRHSIYGVGHNPRTQDI